MKVNSWLSVAVLLFAFALVGICEWRGLPIPGPVVLIIATLGSQLQPAIDTTPKDLK